MKTNDFLNNHHYRDLTQIISAKHMLVTIILCHHESPKPTRGLNAFTSRGHPAVLRPGRHATRSGESERGKASGSGEKDEEGESSGSKSRRQYIFVALDSHEKPEKPKES